MSTKPRVCYLVLAHHQHKVFTRLMRCLSGPDSDVIVHIDARVDIEPFVKEAPAGTHFVRRRQTVRWGSWSLAAAIARTLREGLQRSKADYFIFLAGTDFPVRPKGELLEHLARIYPNNLLNHYPLVPGIWGYSLIDRHRLNDIKSLFVDLRKQGDPNLAKWRRTGLNAAQAMERWLDRRYKPRNTTFMPLYHGSSRWCLNRETAQYVTDYYRSSRSRRLRRFLQLSGNADEIFFQTAILNSPFRKQCLEFDEQECAEIFAGKRAPLEDEKRVYLHYIDWNPKRENPAIIRESDLAEIRKSGKYFACKFVADHSLPALDVIERDWLSADH